MDFNGIRRLYLPLRPKARFSPGRKTPPGYRSPSASLRPLIVHALSAGGRTLSRPLSDSVHEKCDMPSMHFFKIVEDLISACRKHVVAATGPSPFRLETISARNGPCPVPRKPPPESSVPGENLTRGRRRNQLRRGHGSPPVLSEVLHELSTDAHSKE